MKISVTPFNVLSIKELSDKGADVFILGNSEYANRLVYSFSSNETIEANNIIKSLNKEIYISLNQIIHNKDLDKINKYLSFIKKLDVDGIIFSDVAVYQLAKKKKLKHLLIYNPETLNTNCYDPIFWKEKGIKGLTISKEITLEDIKEISKKSEIEISIIGHGHLNMFHSRRPLIENFFKHTNNEYEKYIENRNLTIVEEVRNESYPIFQDNHGTHIFRDKALESYKEINVLNNILDIFMIDAIFKDTEYLIETLNNYQAILSNTNSPEKALLISNSYENDHDSGFLYKKTVYDKY